MKLIGLKVDENPLVVEFVWSPDKKREESSIYQEPYNNMLFELKDQEKIGEIMDYFVKKCDEDKSPQSLFQSKGIDYKTLMKYFKDDSDFDEVLDHMVDLLNISLSDEDRNYIACIDVSFPETWKVDII
ncbi:hypothetical protein ABDJ34_08135 [Finegoldia dalianensis]|uniref:Transcriptional regulator n=1 Tax=Finegoldia dalianensis TaxID=3145239 RepID=A0ABW9KDV5_9FIRM